MMSFNTEHSDIWQLACPSTRWFFFCGIGATSVRCLSWFNLLLV